MEEITLWFENGCDYNDGVAIYLRKGRDPILLSLFRESYSEFKRERLIEAMEELLSGTAVDPSPIAPAKVVSVNVHPGEWPADMDEYLQSLHSQWKPLFLKLKLLENSIYEVAKQGDKNEGKRQQAGRMAHEIIDLEKEVEALYSQRDEYIESGRIERNTGEPVVDMLKWPVILENAKRQVRRYTSLLQKLENPKHRELLKKWESEVVKYKQLLKIEG